MRRTFGLCTAVLGILVLGIVGFSDSWGKDKPGSGKPDEKKMSNQAGEATADEGLPSAKLPKSDVEWRKKLTREQYRVLRQKGTERAFSGKYWNCHKEGVYRCAGCGASLFSSETKFESGTGWPSFWKPSDEKHVASERDSSLGMQRLEVHCARCGGHLGHVFRDGPPPTGLRYCINSASLVFDESKPSKGHDRAKK